MKLDCTFDDTVLKRKLENLLRDPSKNIAYSVQQALNDTVRQIQTDERIAIDQAGFHLRQTGFIYRLVKIFQFAKATSGIAFAEIGIDASKAGVFLQLFEFPGSEKLPPRGNLAVPLYGQTGDPRPTINDILPNALRFRQLKFQLAATPGFGHRASGPEFGPTRGKGVYVGKQGTYLIPGVGIFQRGDAVSGAQGRDAKGRFGSRSNKETSHLIYAFKPDVRLPHLLHFGDVARDTFNRVFQDNFATRFNRAAK